MDYGLKSTDDDDDCRVISQHSSSTTWNMIRRLTYAGRRLMERLSTMIGGLQVGKRRPLATISTSRRMQRTSSTSRHHQCRARPPTLYAPVRLQVACLTLVFITIIVAVAVVVRRQSADSSVRGRHAAPPPPDSDTAWTKLFSRCVSF